jgi:hypothetical protein
MLYNDVDNMFLLCIDQLIQSNYEAQKKNRREEHSLWKFYTIDRHFNRISRLSIYLLFSMLFGVNKRCRRVKNILSKSINIRHTPPSPLWRIKPLPQKKKKANTHREKYRKRNETFIKSNDSTFACCFKINVLTRQAISWLLIFYQRRVMFAQMMTSSMIKTRL